MNFSHQPRRASASWPYFLVGAVLVLVPALVVVAFLLDAEERDSGTTWRDCPAGHTTAGSYVPAGARPCVLRTGAPGAAGTDDSSSRVRDRKQSGRPAPAVKPPAAPAAKAPAAPAAKPPPVAVRK